MLNQHFPCFRSRCYDKVVFVFSMVYYSAVPTDETAASEAVDLHWLLVGFTHWNGRVLVWCSFKLFEGEMEALSTHKNI